MAETLPHQGFKVLCIDAEDWDPTLQWSWLRTPNGGHVRAVAIGPAPMLRAVGHEATFFHVRPKL